MKTYIGVKIIEAEPMNLGDYNKFRGWTIPENEDSSREGYLNKFFEDAYFAMEKSIAEETRKQFKHSIHGMNTH